MGNKRNSNYNPSLNSSLKHSTKRGRKVVGGWCFSCLLITLYCNEFLSMGEMKFAKEDVLRSSLLWLKTLISLLRHSFSIRFAASDASRGYSALNWSNTGKGYQHVKKLGPIGTWACIRNSYSELVGGYWQIFPVFNRIQKCRIWCKSSLRLYIASDTINKMRCAK